MVAGAADAEQSGVAVHGRLGSLLGRCERLVVVLAAVALTAAFAATGYARRRRAVCATA
jgi:hypothetical protein